MLMTRSTPRMTYKIGMRAWLEALEDKSLPSLKFADADGEVATAFKVSINSNVERGRWKEKLGGLALPKYLWKAVSGAGLARKGGRQAAGATALHLG